MRMGLRTAARACRRLRQSRLRTASRVRGALNSKVDHRDYQGDHTHLARPVMAKVGSPHVKLLL